MSVEIESGFDLFDFIDGGGIAAVFNLYDAGDVSQDSFNLSMSISEGNDNLFSHSGFTGYLGNVGGYPSFADTLQALWNADSFDASISFDITTGKYTLAPNTAGWKMDLTFPTPKTLELLGFSSNPSRATSLVSDEVAPFWMQLTSGIGDYGSEDYEAAGKAAVQEAYDGSNAYHIRQPGIAVLEDFTIRHESHQKTYNWYNALQGSPESYTIEQHYEHARNKHWFMVTHEIGTALHRFREGEACLFRAKRFFEEPPDDDFYDIRFETYVAREW